MLGWVAGIAIAAFVVYALLQPGSVPYDETKIGAVDFSSLDASQKQTALVAANEARCDCGCGMALAQCVATDRTCPVRTENIARIRTMVADASR